MICKVEGCKKQTNSKLGYCKKHLKEQKGMMKYIKTTKYFKDKNPNLDYFSFSGLKQTVNSAKSYDTYAKEMRVFR